MPESQASKPSLFEKFVPVLLVAVIGLAFGVGVLWQKVTALEKGGTVKQATAENNQVATPQPVSMDQIKDLFKKDLIKFGDENRKVLFVEMADPSCPYCHVVAGKNPELNRQMDPTGGTFKLISDGGTYNPPEPEMKKLVDSGQASYLLIYTPGHGNGEMGMKALYCAYEKNKFWEVHSLLMTNAGYNLLNNTVRNDPTQADKLISFLKPAISSSDLKACLDSGKYDDRISSDTQLAGSMGVSGTPFFFVNGNSFPGAYDYKQMEPIVTAALK